jgi:hypothetical protein
MRAGHGLAARVRSASLAPVAIASRLGMSLAGFPSLGCRLQGFPPCPCALRAARCALCWGRRTSIILRGSSVPTPGCASGRWAQRRRACIVRAEFRKRPKISYRPPRLFSNPAETREPGRAREQVSLQFQTSDDARRARARGANALRVAGPCIVRAGVSGTQGCAQGESVACRHITAVPCPATPLPLPPLRLRLLPSPLLRAQSCGLNVAGGGKGHGLGWRCATQPPPAAATRTEGGSVP